MSRWISLALLLCSFSAQAFQGVGRPATPAEIRAWDIDVRADFQGLPRGSGSARQGEEIWEAKCASCHGSFGESNAFYPPIAGGVTAEDVKRGRVAALTRNEQRTTMMKLSQISTLWDYINRAMPWNAPKSLKADEVYALTAYILSLDKIVPEDFVLSDANMAQAQERLPNRNGMTRAHGLWDVRGKPDVRSTACMKDCPVEARITSELPESARGNHGNLAEQHRLIGPTRGVVTAAAAPEPKAASAAGALAERAGCMGCHALSARLVGPSFREIAAKYARDASAEARLAGRVREGSQGAWGPVPMPPQRELNETDLRTLVRWVLSAE